MAPLSVHAQTYVNINTESASARAHFAKGMAAADANRASDARSHFDMAIEADPTLAAAHLYRAQSATSGADYMQHFGNARALRETASDFIRIRIDVAEAQLESDTERARELTEDLVAMHPNNPRARVLLGNVYAAEKKTAMSRLQFNAAIELDGSFALARKALARSFIDDKPANLTRARREAVAYWLRSPDEPVAYLLLGDVSRAEGNFKAARDSYADAASIDPQNPTARSMQGHANSFLGDYEAARSDYQAAAELSETISGKSDFGNFGVNTYLYAGDVDGALAANATVAQGLLDAGLPDADITFPLINTYMRRAMIAMHYGRFDVAEKALRDRTDWTNKAAVQVPALSNPIKSTVVFWNGMLAARRGDLQQARQLATQNKAMLESGTDPRRFEANHHLLAAIESASGNHDAAIAHLVQADVDGVWVKYETAVANEKAGHADKAQELYKEIANWNFNELWTALYRNEAASKVKAPSMTSK
jgi:tetratricopeptide (TPR) repeat protein